MAENKKYYYLKLKEDFFDSEDIKVLESMENGYLYSNILLKMYLKSLKNKGELVFKDYIPYDTKMLSIITGHNIDIVDKALCIFKKLGFIDVMDNGTIFMLDIQKMIGSISDEGKRKAEYREKIEAQKHKKEIGTLSQDCPDIMSNYMSNPHKGEYNSISNSFNGEENENDNEKSYHDSSDESHDDSLKNIIGDKNPMATFFEQWNITTDDLNSREAYSLSAMDFDKINQAMERSTYLQTQQKARFSTFYIRNYKRIIAGYYDDDKHEPNKGKNTSEPKKHLYDMEAIKAEDRSGGLF